MFQKKGIEKLKVSILCSVNFFLKIMPLMRSCKKYGQAKQITDDNIMRPSVCVLDV